MIKRRTYVKDQPIRNTIDLQNRSVSYLKCIDLLKTKYVVSYDHGFTNKDNEYRIVKRFIGLPTEDEYIKAFTITNKNKERVMYEVFTDYITKGYFDIDAENITNADITEFVENFCEKASIMLNIRLIPNDIIIMNRSNEEPYTSIHIVFNVGISKTDMLLLTHTLKYMDKTAMCSKLDIKVYSKNQQFNAINNTKLKYYNTDNTAEHTSFKTYDYLGNTIKLANIKDGLIRIVDKSHETKISNTYRLIAVMSKIWNSSKFKIPTIHDIFNGWRQIVYDNKPKIQFHLDDIPTTLYDYLCENLPKSFYNNSKDWKCIVKMLKKKGLHTDDFKQFNIKSIEHTTKWNLEDNIRYYDGLHQNHLKPYIPSFIETIQKYIPNMVINYKSGYSIYKWIMNVLQIPTEDHQKYDYIIDDLEPSNEDTIDTFEIMGKLYKFDTKSGNMYMIDGDVHLLVGSYLFDVNINRFSKNMELSPTIIRHTPSIIKTDTLDNINQIITDFINSNGMILGIGASWGSGKTSKCMVEVINQTNNQVILITENNSLNQNVLKTLNNGIVKNGEVIYEGFGGTMKQFTSHLSKKEFQEAVINSNNLICSLESIHKVKITKDTIVILDEYESILNHFSSNGTFRDKTLSVESFFTIIRTSHKIICLDADLSMARMEIVYDLNPSLNKVMLYSSYNAFWDYKIKVFKNPETLKPFIINYIRNNPTKRIIVPTSSSNFGDDLTGTLYVNFKHTHTILFICQDTCKIMYKTTDHRYIEDEDGLSYNGVSINKNEILTNINTDLEKYGVDVFIFTPTIKTGVSIDNPYFNICIANAVSMSICVREFIQSLFRSRMLIDKEIYIQTQYGVDFTKMKHYLSYSQVYKYMNLPIQAHKTLTIYQVNNKEYLKNLNKIDEHITSPMDDVVDNNTYARIQLINHYEHLNSNKLFTQDLLMRLKITHKLNVEIYDPPTKRPDETNLDDNIHPTTHPFIRYNLLTHREYEHHKLNDTISSIPTEQLTIYELFFKRFLFKGISNIKIPYCDDYNYDDMDEEDEPNTISNVANLRMMNRHPTKYPYEYTEHDKFEIRKINELYEYDVNDRSTQSLIQTNKSYIPHKFSYNYIPIQNNKPLTLYKHTYYPKYKHSIISVLDEDDPIFDSELNTNYKSQIHYKVENKPIIIYKKTPQNTGDTPIILTDYISCNYPINYSNISNIYNYKTEDLKLYNQHININYNNRIYDLHAHNPHLIFIEKTSEVNIIADTYKNLSFQLVEQTLQLQALKALKFGITNSKIKMSDVSKKKCRNIAFLFVIQTLRIDLYKLPIYHKFKDYNKIMDDLLYSDKSNNIFNLEFITRMNSYLEFFTIAVDKPKQYKTEKSYKPTKYYINPQAPTDKHLRAELTEAFKIILEIGGIEIKTANTHSNKRDYDKIVISYHHYQVDNNYSCITNKPSFTSRFTEPIIVVDKSKHVKCIQKNTYRYTYTENNIEKSIIMYPSFNKNKEVICYKNYRPIQIEHKHPPITDDKIQTFYKFCVGTKFVNINPIVCNHDRFVYDILGLQPNPTDTLILVDKTNDKCKCRHRVPYTINDTDENYCMNCGGKI